MVDCISNFLRLYAQNDPDGFSSNIAHIIGNGLVCKIKKSFEKYKNYKVFCDIKLSKFDLKLPDIDILTISYEPSLGFHLFVAEVKNSLPAVWGKEYLKASSKKGYLTKALSQVKTISDFLDTEQGQTFLLDLILNNFKDLELKKIFPHGFCIIKNMLIITSQSVGMFFPDNKIPIIDGETLSHIIDASDGDTNYIKFHVNQLNKIIDNCMESCSIEMTVGGYRLKCDAVKIGKFFELAEHSYLSDGTFEKLEKDSIDSGYTMAGSLLHKNNVDFHVGEYER